MQPQPLANTRCPLCGADNQCAPARCGSFEVECWCRTVQIAPQVLAQIPEQQRGLACLCPRCAAGLAPQADEG